MKRIFEFFTSMAPLKIMIYAGIALAAILFLVFAIRRFSQSKANRSARLFGLSGRGDFSHTKNKITIEYYKKIFFIFRLWTGTISYILANENLYINYELKRETGDRVVSLESIYSTSESRQKRRPLLLILAIILAVCVVIVGIIGFIHVYLVIAGVAFALILLLLWYFQKKMMGFSILFGGVGEAGSHFLTSSSKDGEDIGTFIKHLNNCVRERQDAISAKSLHGVLNAQNNLISALKESVENQSNAEPKNGLPKDLNRPQPAIHTYNNASTSAQSSSNNSDIQNKIDNQD